MVISGIKTIIWDLDGTLIDSFSSYQLVLAKVVKARGLQMPNEQVLKENYHGRLEDSLGKALGKVNQEELTAIARDYVLEQQGYYDLVNDKIFPDALRLAERAGVAGIFQVIVTNRGHIGRLNASPRSIVERSSLRGLIDHIICGDESNYHKPEPEVLNSLLEIRKLIPEKTLVIGDQFLDAQFALNLEAKSIIVSRETNTPPHLEKLGKDWQKCVTIVRSLDEVEF